LPALPGDFPFYQEPGAMKLNALVDILQCRPLLRRKDLARRFGVIPETVDRWHRAGKLPLAVYLPGCSIPLWRPADIDSWETRNKRKRK
jgi:predicted DNA-binding transcriptional regulator AlpA